MPILFFVLLLFSVASYSQPVVNLGRDTVICKGDRYVLDAGNPGSTYLWSTEETTQKITVYQTGIYSVNITDSTGNKARGQVEVVFQNSQYRQTSNWVFGNGGKVVFRGRPDSLASSLNFPAGSSAISSPDGRLLFFTNSGTIYDINGNVMLNGDDIAGDPDYRSNSIIIPKPGSAMGYYVFTIYPDIGLYYSIVNMSGNGGLGEVVQKNTLLDEYAGDFTATIAFDNVNMWLIVLNKNSNVFYAYKIERDKINDPVISATGPIIGSSNQIKITPNGDKIAVADGENVYLYKFFNDKGEVQFIRSFPLPGSQGVEFSKGNNNLYISDGNGGNIYQFSIAPVTDTASPHIIYQSPTPVFYGDLQLGMNGSIYVANDGQNCLPEIKDANTISPSVNAEGMCLMAGATSTKDLPTFPQNYFKSPPGLGGRWNDTCQNFQEIISAQFFLDKYPFAKVKYHFDLGDGTTLDTNYALHTWTKPGTYKIKLTVTSVCDPIVREAEVHIDSIPKYIPMRDTVICIGSSVVLNPQADSIYRQVWSTGETSKAITVDQTGNYSVIIKGVKCDAKDTAFVKVNNFPDPGLKDWDWICLDKHESLTIQSKEGDKFLWYPSKDSTQSITVDTLGIYKVLAINEGNCATLDSIKIIDLCEAVLFPPDVFTPNNDKVNDIFLPLGKYLQAYELRIYDRWGEVIFVSKDPDIGWDGTYRGREAEGGAYVYVIIFESIERDKPNSVHKLHGNLLLLR